MVLQVLNTSEFVNLITKKTVLVISYIYSLGLPKISLILTNYTQRLYHWFITFIEIQIDLSGLTTSRIRL